MSYLMLCPFCAGRAEVIPAEPNEVTRVHCIDCDAEAAPGNNEEEAIDNWNTRWGFETTTFESWEHTGVCTCSRCGFPVPEEWVYEVVGGKKPLTKFGYCPGCGRKVTYVV